MESQRRHQRTELNEIILARDLLNGGIFGELVNASLGGMMIMTENPVPTQSIFQLDLQLPRPLLGDDHIQVGVDCLWCRQTEHCHRYWAGFQIIDASDHALARLQAMIEHFGQGREPL